MKKNSHVKAKNQDPTGTKQHPDASSSDQRPQQTKGGSLLEVHAPLFGLGEITIDSHAVACCKLDEIHEVLERFKRGDWGEKPGDATANRVTLETNRIAECGGLLSATFSDGAAGLIRVTTYFSVPTTKVNYVAESDELF
jgi:hypothetical protein